MLRGVLRPVKAGLLVSVLLVLVGGARGIRRLGSRGGRPITYLVI